MEANKNYFQQNCKYPSLALRILFVSAILLTTGCLSGAKAQTFDEARKLAFDGQRVKARHICRAILAKEFDSDVALLMGRTYAWDGLYDSTRIVLNQVLERNPKNMEALDAFADVEYWSENYDAAVKYCDQALQIDPKDGDFVLKKARILHSAERYKEAVSTLEDLIAKDKTNAEALKKLQEYRLDVMKNRVRLNYTVDRFDKSFNRDPWQVMAISYSRKTKLGTILGRFNYAERFGTTGAQFEMDAYPKISENNYLYVNYGFSQNSVFPKNRAGIDWNHSFPKAFEGSLGFRLLDFSSSNVYMYTATVGKYIGNYWISARSYVTPGTDGTSVSGYLQARRYFSDPENYLGLRIGYGVSPDENQNLVDVNAASRLKLKTQSIRLEFNHLLGRYWIFNPAFGVGNEELKSGSFSGYYTIDISLTRIF